MMHSGMSLNCMPVCRTVSSGVNHLSGYVTNFDNLTQVVGNDVAGKINSTVFNGCALAHARSLLLNHHQTHSLQRSAKHDLIQAIRIVSHTRTVGPEFIRVCCLTS